MLVGAVVLFLALVPDMDNAINIANLIISTITLHDKIIMSSSINTINKPRVIRNPYLKKMKPDIKKIILLPLKPVSISPYEQRTYSDKTPAKHRKEYLTFLKPENWKPVQHVNISDFTSKGIPKYDILERIYQAHVPSAKQMPKDSLWDYEVPVPGTKKVAKVEVKSQYTTLDKQAFTKFRPNTFAFHSTVKQLKALDESQNVMACYLYRVTQKRIYYKMQHVPTANQNWLEVKRVTSSQLSKTKSK